MSDKRMAFVYSASVLLLLFASLSGAFVKPASANFFPETPPLGMQIGVDGSVNGTDNIQQSGGVYTFTGNITGSIVVLCSNIVLDGAGYTLTGQGNSTGIFMQGVDSVTVKNLRVTNFQRGIAITWKTTGNAGQSTCGRHTIADNVLANNTVGISLNMWSGENTIRNNTITDGTQGIAIFYSVGNNLSSNHISGNKYNVWIDCTSNHLPAEFINNIDETNMVNGKPVYFWVNQHNRTVPSDAGYVALVNCTNITMQGARLANNSQGILLIAVNHTTIKQNVLTGNCYGLVFLGSHVPTMNVEVTENAVSENENGVIIWNDYLENDEFHHNLLFHHNNFINNTVQVGNYSFGGTWDNGAIGNFWSNYNGTDANGDGVGDTLHVVIVQHISGWGNITFTHGSTDEDHFPLISPVNITEPIPNPTPSPSPIPTLNPTSSSTTNPITPEWTILAPAMIMVAVTIGTIAWKKHVSSQPTPAVS